MRISDWSSDVCSSDKGIAYGDHPIADARRGAVPEFDERQATGIDLQNREIGCDITTDQLRLIFLTIGQDDSDAVNHGSGRAAGYNMGVRDDVAVRGYDEAGAQRLRFTGLRLSRKAKQAAERRSGEGIRSEEHTSELQSLMRISYAVFCLKK